MAVDTEPAKRIGPSVVDGYTWATVDLTNRDLVERLKEQDRLAAGERIKAAVKRLQDLGVIDSEGRRLNPELPADMRDDSETDFGG